MKGSDDSQKQNSSHSQRDGEHEIPSPDEKVTADTPTPHQEVSSNSGNHNSSSKSTISNENPYQIYLRMSPNAKKLSLKRVYKIRSIWTSHEDEYCEVKQRSTRQENESPGGCSLISRREDHITFKKGIHAV